MADPPSSPSDIPSETAPPSDPKRTHPIWALANPRYRLLWVSAFFAQLGQQGLRVMSLYLVYELTGSPLMLGLLGAFQVVPLLLLSLAGGSLADKFDRKKLILLTQVFRIVLGCGLVALQLSGVLNVWHLYGAAFLSTAGSVMERPSQVALLPTILPPQLVTGAILLNSVNNQLTRTVGPGVAGLLLATIGVSGTFILNVALYALSFLVALGLPSAIAKREGEEQNMLQLMREGLTFVLGTPIILSLLMLDAVATFFGAFEPLMPVFAEDVLHVGPQGLGVLLAASGGGAVLGVLIVLNLTWVRHKGRMVLGALFCYGLALIAFGLSPIYALSIFVVALLGALDQVNVTFRNTILLLVTPDQLRGRIESIRMMFIIGAPALGAVQAGAIASVIGAPFTIAGEAFFVLAGVLFIGKRVREVREVEI